MSPAIIALLALVVACQSQPRSTASFEARPKEAAQVLAACAKGAHRGRECECEAARQGEAAIKARLQLFRRGVE